MRRPGVRKSSVEFIGSILSSPNLEALAWVQSLIRSSNELARSLAGGENRRLIYDTINMQMKGAPKDGALRDALARLKNLIARSSKAGAIKRAAKRKVGH
jgi:hypothetical protein